ncbi:helix-turn-helix transcriptional regulator [Streptomyces sp. SPB4]|uniref:helix-turn-helix transcriptional regulator n=1 Tax=Streptomyces sp. SPB4 TaxID=2940553 RepID=UPI0024757D2A|nr:helix-turn-helix transcriptional regulator [Streptomyces sp. SPB4]MDH6538448.1 AraC-like DNA-binding protein [Streptomyces sp. SPB4]
MTENLTHPHSHQYQPTALLRGIIRNYSSYAYGCSPRSRILMPNTVATLNFAFGEAVHTRDMADRTVTRLVSSQTDLPTATALLARHDGNVSGVAVRFSPIGAYRLFGVPMRHWGALDLDPVQLFPPSLRSLPERLREAAPQERPRLLDRMLPALLQSGPAVAPEVLRAWRELHRTQGRRKTAQLAADTQWSVRHLQRRFQEQVGRSPAEIARILRFTHALRLRGTGMALGKVAQLAGYHDQAHLHLVFRKATGLTPTQLPLDQVDWNSALAKPLPE